MSKLPPQSIQLAEQATKSSPTPREVPPGYSPVSGTAPPREHRWKPGQSGNPKGRPPSLGLSLIERLNTLGDDGLSLKQLEVLAESDEVDIRDRAAAKRLIEVVNDPKAWHAMCDRTLGKPKLRIDTATKVRPDAAELVRQARAAAGIC